MDNFEKYLTERIEYWSAKGSEYAIGAVDGFKNALLKYQLEKELKKGKTR